MNQRRYTKEILEEAVSHCQSVADVVRYFGLAYTGGNGSHLKRRIVEYGIDISHFKGQAWSKGVIIESRRKHASEILTKYPAGHKRISHSQLKRAMFESGVAHICSKCGQLPEWQGKELVLIIDHINGDYTNNTLKNLRFVCPNCNSQLDTHCGRKPRVNCSCGAVKSKKASRCKACYTSKYVGKHKHSTKISWPPKHILAKMVKQSSYLAVGRKLGVSDNAVRKHLLK